MLPRGALPMPGNHDSHKQNFNMKLAIIKPASDHAADRVRTLRLPHRKNEYLPIATNGCAAAGKFRARKSPPQGGADRAAASIGGPPDLPGLLRRSAALACQARGPLKASGRPE